MENDVRSLSVLALNSINAMCNAKDVDVVTSEFIKAKDYILEIFRIKATEVSK